MKMQISSKEMALAYHEAGHAIMALYFDIPFTEVSIIENETNLGRLLLDKFELPIDCQQLSEQFWGGISKVSENYLKFLHSLTESHFVCFNGRMRLVNSDLWKNIARLAKRLHKKKVLTYEEVEEIYFN